ncbi:MAG: hypothetical protein DWQ02_26820 [Bacteroidetes bacterium]|nr:MAG: hypothetical protein DWQ02_26820 [Bacteroidota bacterium]
MCYSRVKNISAYYIQERLLISTNKVLQKIIAEDENNIFTFHIFVGIGNKNLFHFQKPKIIKMKRLTLFFLFISLLQSCYIPLEIGDAGDNISSGEERRKQEAIEARKRQILPKVKPYLEAAGIELMTQEEMELLKGTIAERSAKLGKNILLNSSFEEGQYGASLMPDYWRNCGWASESPSDLHLSGGVAFDVYQEAVDGYQYVGMVVRSNGTHECIFQEFEPYILPGEYDLLMVVSRSEVFNSVDQVTGEEASYHFPVTLQIFGKNEIDDTESLLFMTYPIDFTDWHVIQNTFVIEENTSAIKIAAFFTDDEYYNGNVLIDKIIIAKR